MTHKDKALTEGVDYEVVYENNVNAGVATVTVKGIGEYAGTVALDFHIAPRVAELVWDNTYLEFNFENQVPTATVGNLVEGDECAVIVEGRGKYEGTFTAYAVALSNPNYTFPENATVEYTIWADSYKVAGEIIPESVKTAVAEAVSDAVSDAVEGLKEELASTLENALKNALESLMEELKNQFAKNFG